LANDTLTVATALRWFALDPLTVDERAVKAAFRKKAKECHPDGKSSYREKLAGAENFRAAIAARDLLLEELGAGRLPQTPAVEAAKVRVTDEEARRRLDEVLGEIKRQRGSKPGRPKSDSQRKEKRGASLFGTPRGEFDYHNPRPMERLMDLPVIGPILTVPFLVAAIGGLIAGFVVVLPLMAIHDIIMAMMGEEKRKRAENSKAINVVVSLLTIPFYYASTAIGIWFFSEGREDFFVWSICLVWGVLTLFLFDELYSLVRFHVAMRGTVRTMTLVLAETSD
jgi:hypothetical protein